MDIAGEQAVGIGEDGLRAVGEDDLDLSAALADELLIVFDIIDAGKGVAHRAEQLAEARKRQHIAVRVNVGCVEGVEADDLVAHLVRGIAEHQHDPFSSAGDAAQADGEAVAREDGEQNADRPAAQLGSDVGGDSVGRCIVALRARHDRFRHRHNVAVVQRKAVARGGSQHAFGHDGGEVVSLADDGAADAARNCANFSFPVHNF